MFNFFKILPMTAQIKFFSNFSEWIQGEMVAVFSGVLAIASVWYLIQRKVTKLVILIFLSGIAAVFLFNGTEFGKMIADQIMDLMQ